ncbi:hypothetical protein IU433_24235 [Nocardia puris]|uniref:Uncharacterized protein n=1 Tax=Nocardia puris TaxID=208602 RepID=A0A366DHF6_9NOCA|nr:hypothetical protein [Nocardia puris]MBF6213244.1 hypothetical protein [Nocardia puris]MBF6369836.1 hypothetical protein [Nocardia puris]MBF6462123.1 hypothetical protein [Nocardia puris]RBO89426.1 hypothetical protein DFR74_107104 [Nocardia puris]
MATAPPRRKLAVTDVSDLAGRAVCGVAPVEAQHGTDPVASCVLPAVRAAGRG